MEFIKKIKGIEAVKVGDMVRKPTYLKPGGDTVIKIERSPLSHISSPKFTLIVSGWDGDYMLSGYYGNVVEVYVEAA